MNEQQPMAYHPSTALPTTASVSDHAYPGALPDHVLETDGGDLSEWFDDEAYRAAQALEEPREEDEQQQQYS